MLSFQTSGILTQLSNPSQVDLFKLANSLKSSVLSDIPHCSIVLWTDRVFCFQLWPLVFRKVPKTKCVVIVLHHDVHHHHRHLRKLPCIFIKYKLLSN